MSKDGDVRPGALRRATGLVTPPPTRERVPEEPLLVTPPERPRTRSQLRFGWAGAVGAVLVGAFLLRIWGVGHGLPYAFNADENAHFVPRAIGLYGHGWNPGYFVNPPAFTYILHVIFAVWFGGSRG